MSNLVANFASGVGKRDIILLNGPVVDVSAVVGETTDLSLNAAMSQSLQFITQFTTFSPTLGNGISFSGWFYPSGNQTAGSTIFDIQGDATSVSLLYKTANTLSAFYNGVTLDSSYIIVPNAWHFFSYTVFCTYATKALQTLYIDPGNNPSPMISQTVAPYVAFSSTGNNFLGYGKGANDVPGIPYGYFNGKLDDFRFYNRVLASAEINVLSGYTNTSPLPTPVVTSANSVAYDTAVRVDVSGTFSGLNITRNPPFPTTGVDVAYNTTTNPVFVVTGKDLVSVDGYTWSYVDTTVAPGQTYSYTLTPYIPRGNLYYPNPSYGTPTTVSSLSTLTLRNNNFTALTTGSLPAYDGSYVVAPAIANWSFTVTPDSQYYLNRGRGPLTGINQYTNALPSNITYYVAVQTAASSTNNFSQSISMYQNARVNVSFYAWTLDNSLNTAPLKLSVSVGGTVLLNAYPLSVGTGIPMRSFSLPVTLTTSLFSTPVTFTVTNTSTTGPNTMCFSPIQFVRNQTEGVFYTAIDPSGLQLYYPLDVATTAGKLTNYASGTGTADGTMVNTNLQSAPPVPVGTAYLYTNGGPNSYAKLGNWTCPTASAQHGFTIAGWVCPSIPVNQEPSGATVVSLSNMTGGHLSLYLRQPGILDLSCSGVRGIMIDPSNQPLVTGQWTFFTVTCAGTRDGSGTYTYYLNDTCMNQTVGNWPDTRSTYSLNYLGGVPNTTVIEVDGSTNLCNFTGYMDDFRIYNRALTSQDIYALWNLGQSAGGGAGVNTVDPTNMNFYYSFN